MKKSLLLHRFQLEKLHESWSNWEFHLIDIVDSERFIISISTLTHNPMDICLGQLVDKIQTKRNQNLDKVLISGFVATEESIN